GLDVPRCPDERAVTDADVPVAEVDAGRTNAEHESRLAHPRQAQDPRAAGGSEEDRLERGLLLGVGALVHVEDARPRRAVLVVVVARGEGDAESRQRELVGEAVVDPPAQQPEALAVGRSAAGHAPDHPARTDRLAVARLEVVPTDPPGRQSHVSTAAVTST